MLVELRRMTFVPLGLCIQSHQVFQLIRDLYHLAGSLSGQTTAATHLNSPQVRGSGEPEFLQSLWSILFFQKLGVTLC